MLNRLLAVFATLMLIAALMLSAVQAVAQEAAAPEGDAPASDFFDVVEVEIVNIDVFVTDKRGEPVTGLTRDDFTVFSDGRPAEITNFYVVEDGRERTGSEAARAVVESPAPERQPSLKLSPELAPEHRLWMIVYVDNYNINSIERTRVFPAVRRFLGSSLRAGDKAMLVSYSRKLEVRQPFTDQLTVLHSALDELEDDTGFAAIRRRELISTLKAIDDADSPAQAMVRARNFAEEQMNGVQYTTDALIRMIDSLGGLPGRKAVVHVSSGMPMVAGEAAFEAVGEKFGSSEAYAEIARHDTSRGFARISRHANAHRVAFYTVDAGGLRGLEFGNAEYGGFVNSKLRRILDSVVPENLQAPLRFMALETGGRAIVNQNEILPALEEASQDFRTFYSLGIPSTDSESGRYHKIEVKLREKQKGVSLRHRAGFRSKTTDTRVRDSLRSALLYAHQENPDNVEVTWGRAERHGEDGHYLLPIQLRIPLRDVVLLPTANGKHELRLRLYVGAVGGDGETSDIDSVPLGLRLAAEHVEAARSESFVYTHKLLLSPGRKRVGIAILDLVGRDASVVTGSILVGPPADTG